MSGGMGHSAPISEDENPEMREQRRKNITTVLQKLSDKQSSGYESGKESELYAQTPTEPGVPSIHEDLPEHPQEVRKMVHTVTEYEQVMVRGSKVKQDSYGKYQQEIVQRTSTSTSSSLHSVRYPTPKPLPSFSAFQSLSDPDRMQQKQSAFVSTGLTSGKADFTLSTPPSYSRQPVIVSSHPRPHLWKSHSQAGPRETVKSADDSQDVSVPMDEKPASSAPGLSKHKTIDLFPPAECRTLSLSSPEKDELTTSSKKKDPSYPKSYKKYLQERYLQSLKEPEPKKAELHDISSTDLSKKRLEELKSDSEHKNPSFSSTDSEGREGALHSEVFIHVKDVAEEEGTENKDDVFEVGENPARSSTSSKTGRREEPLDLTSKQPLRPSATFVGQDRPSEEMRSPGTFPPQLSPSMYHHSPPMFYPPQHEIVSPRSPLWSVPEGKVFNFNLSSPFEQRSHSDPEFLSPGFSPDSPGLHFTFPPRSPFLSSSGEHSRMPKSPRLVYQGNQTRFPSSSNQPLPKLFCSPPQVSDFTRPSDGSAAQGSELTYICPVCGQVFPSYDNLAKHMAKHLPTETIKTADNNKVHYCKVCNRAFSRSDMLTRHMRLHTGLKPYECRVCGQVFSRSDHLNTHQRTHTGEKPYRCPQCPYAACRRDMITRHMRIHSKRSSKRGKYLSVPEGESSEVRKSSVSSTDTTDSQEHSGRTCSVSSVDSVESESGQRKHSATSGDSFEMEGQLPAAGSRLWSSASAESTDFEENPQFRQSTSAFYVDSPGPFLEPMFTYRKSRNWSTTSFESIDSEGSGSRRDSVADDFGEFGGKEPSETQSSRDTPVIDDDSLRKFTISSDDIQN